MTMKQKKQCGSGSQTSHLPKKLKLPQGANRAADNQCPNTWLTHTLLQSLGSVTSSHWCK